MAAVNTFVILTGIVFVLFALGILNFLTGNDENGCQMTYMFQYPQYVKVSLPPEISRQYPRYGLYAYGEGHHTEKLRQMKFSGIPVLFIPGNSGSHKQVRSLASVSLQKAIDSRTPFHFDYFSLDLNEEYSALFGGFLKDQRNFAHHCIHRILQLYKHAHKKPTSVILIGHSMGGMVAKALFTDPAFDKDLVKVIVTLVTPHKGPVLALDTFIARYYSEVNEYWIANRRPDGGGNLSHVTFISIGGGHRDILVRSGLTETKEADINVLSTAVPAVWLSTDHLCSVWCKELVLVVVRALFDIVNLTTMQVMENIDERRNIFHYHMVHRTAGKRFSTAFHPREIYFNHNGVWNEHILRQFSVIEPNGVRLPTYMMIRLVNDPKHEMAAIEAINSHDKDWIFACNADLIENDVRKCEWGINLSNKAVFLPSRNQKRKFIHLDLAALYQMPFTHVVIAIQPTKEMVQFNIDIHSAGSRHLSVALPKWISFPFRKSVLDMTADGAVYYDMAVPGFEQSWQAYLLHVTPLACQGAAHHAVTTMEVPWSKEDVHAYATDALSRPLHMRLQTTKPSHYTSNGTVHVRLVLDPSCKYSVKIQSAVLDSLGQLVRFYSPMLLAYIVAILLLTVAYQLKMQAETGQFVMFHSAMAQGAKPYYILPAAKIAAKILGFSLFTRVLGVPDSTTLQDQNLEFLLLPVYLYSVAFAVIYILGIAAWAAIIFSGNAAHKMALRFIAKAITLPTTWSDWVLSGMSKLPISVAGLLIFLTYHTCGTLSLCLGAGYFFLKLCKMYEEVLEELFKYSMKLLAKKIFPFKKEDKCENAKQCEEEESASSDDKQCEDKSAGDEQAQADDEDTSPAETGDSDKVVTSQVQDLPSTEENAASSTVPNSKEATHKESASSTLSELNFLLTVFFLWVIVMVVNIPSVLVWAHSFKYSRRLNPDPSLATAVVLCSCAGVLWQGKLPSPDMKGYKDLQRGLWCLALLTLVYGPLSLYQLNSVVTTAFVLLTVPQVVAVVLPPPPPGASEEEQPTPSSGPT